MDWTYDLFIEDVEKYGIGAAADASADYRAYFVATTKVFVKRFKDRWMKDHDGHLYDHGWAGDEFAKGFLDWFSDFYKEAYGQRPHLPLWFYIHPLGLPMREDTARGFCSDPIGNAIYDAKEAREAL